MEDISAEAISELRENATHLLDSILSLMLKKHRLFGPPMTIKHRIKETKRIKSKVQRERKENPDYGLKDVTDVIGIRIVTLYSEDNADVAKTIFRFFEDGEGGMGERNIRLAKAKLYWAHSQLTPDSTEKDAFSQNHSVLTRLVDNYNDRSGVEPVILEDPKRGNYSSIHLVADWPYGDPNDGKTMPVEIQVRSIFEDAYAEIDHKIFYELDREDELGAGRRRRVREELHLLRSMLDNASKLADIIRRRQSPTESVGKPDIAANLDDANWFEHLALSAGEEYEDVLSAFTELLDGKAKIDDDESAEPGEYKLLAERFDALERRFNSRLERDEMDDKKMARLRRVAYVVYQEGALCRLLTGEEAEVKEAKKRYRRLAESESIEPGGFDFRQFPTAWFRLAQANAFQIEASKDPKVRANRAEEAFEKFTIAQKNFELLQDRGLIGQISRPQIDYLRQNTIRLQSLVFWRLSDIRRRPDPRRSPLEPIQEDFEHVTRAWETIRELAELNWGIPAEKLAETKHAMDIYNTALYFIFDGYNLAHKLGIESHGFPDLSRLEELTDKLQSSIDLMEEDPPINYRHTLMRCLLVLEGNEVVSSKAAKMKREQAKAQAGLIFDKHHGQDPVRNITPYRQWDTQRIVREAYLVMTNRDLGEL